MSSEPKVMIERAIKDVIGDSCANLHEPYFDEYDSVSMARVLECGFVSSTGPFLDEFEQQLQIKTGARHAIAVVNGTCALALALLASGVKPNTEVLLPALTFVATANSIIQASAIPHFVESESASYGICCASLRRYLEENCKLTNGKCINISSGNVISAIVPVHVFGCVADMTTLCKLAEEFNLLIIEDSAEALGSKHKGIHAGNFGESGALSFNGNKIITTGGGGAVITNDDAIADNARHIAAQAKMPHPYRYYHDQYAFNFRMPALNAALGCSQLDKLDRFLNDKRTLTQAYMARFSVEECCYFWQNQYTDTSNKWLNAIQLTPELESSRDSIIDHLHSQGLKCRPIWDLISNLPHLRGFPSMPLGNARQLVANTINLPSSPFLIGANYAR